MKHPSDGELDDWLLFVKDRWVKSIACFLGTFIGDAQYFSSQIAAQKLYFEIIHEVAQTHTKIRVNSEAEEK